MKTPFWRNIINAEMLNKKNRYVLIYVSVFFILLFSLVTLSSFKPISNKTSYLFPDTDDTIYVYDTVFYYDTTYYYDTIYINRSVDTNKITIKKPLFSSLFKEKPNINITTNKSSIKSYGKYLFSIDLLVSPMFFKHSFSSDFIYKNVSQINNNSVQEELSTKIGLGFNFHKPFTTISSGIFFSNYHEKFNYLVSDFLIDTILAYRYFTTTEIKIDTIEFYNIDSLLIGDTVIENYYDTTRITSLDSTLFSKIDSLEYKKNDRANNSYTFIEIPLIFNFNFHKSNISISPQVGIITSFFMDSKGKIVSLNNINQSIDIEKETKFSKVNLSIYGGVRINYFLSKRFDFFTTAYFKKSLNSLFIDYPIVSLFNTYGLSFGLRYKFIY